MCIAAALPAPSVELLHAIVPLCGEFLNILVVRFLPLPLLFLGLSCRFLLPAKRIVGPRPPEGVARKSLGWVKKGALLDTICSSELAAALGQP